MCMRCSKKNLLWIWTFVRHTLAHQIAQEIQLLREQPSHFQSEDSASSPLKESDICILFRSKAEGVFIAKVFTTVSHPLLLLSSN